MMRLPANNPLINVLLVSCCLLVLLFAMEWLFPYRIGAATNVDAEADATRLPGDGESAYAHPHIDDFPAILARPIFFENRELPPESVAQATAPHTPLRLRLEGIAIVADARIAVLRDEATNQLLQLSVGMSHNDWVIDDIIAAGATFRRGDDVAQLTLEIGNR
jgi:hypothetical protein